MSKSNVIAPSIGLDAIVSGVQALPPLPDGMRMVGSEVGAQDADGKVWLLFYCKRPGKGHKPFAYANITVPAVDVGRVVTLKRLTDVSTDEEVQSTVAAMREFDLLPEDERTGRHAKAVDWYGRRTTKPSLGA